MQSDHGLEAQLLRQLHQLRGGELAGVEPGRHQVAHALDRELGRDFAYRDAVGGGQHLPLARELGQLDIDRGDAQVERRRDLRACQVEARLGQLRAGELLLRRDDGALRRDQVELVGQLLHPLLAGQDGTLLRIDRGLGNGAARAQLLLALQVAPGERQRARLDGTRALQVLLPRRHLGEPRLGAGEHRQLSLHRELMVGGVDTHQDRARRQKLAIAEERVHFHHLARHLGHRRPLLRRLDGAVSEGPGHDRDPGHGDHAHGGDPFLRRQALRRLARLHGDDDRSHAQDQRRQEQQAPKSALRAFSGHIDPF